MSAEYYFIKDATRIAGPFTRAKIVAMRDSGRIDQNTMISTNKQQWIYAGKLPWLYHIPEPPREISNPTVRTEPRAPAVVQNPEPPPVVENPPPRSVANPDNPPIRRNVSQSRAGGNNVPGDKAAVIDVCGDVLSLFWEPGGALGRIYARTGEKGAWMAALGMAVLGAAGFVAYILIGHQALPHAANVRVSISKVLMTFAVMWIFIAISCFLVRMVWGRQNSGGPSGDILIAACPPLYLSAFIGLCLALGRLIEIGRVSKSGPIMIIAFGFLCIWLAANSVITIFEGLTGISGVKKSHAGLLVSCIFTATGVMIFYTIKTLAKL